MDYRSISRYANSDLTEFRNLFFGYPVRPRGPAQAFGTAFHELILEQELTIELTTALQKQADQMRNALQKDSFARLVLQEARKEVIEVWDDDQTGLPCKSRLDLWLPSEEMIVDVKTTSARSYREFLASCLAYDYDRQGAFYLDSKPPASRFVLLGVQKQAPFSIFYFEATACKGCIEGGRKKYHALLREVRKCNFQPSSWALTTAAIQPLTRQAS
ncbi:PD-(D/E)XK nuclease-like domain-containing protein [Larkinella humicola]|uniref:Putative exodeoxyribonuclease 8 PDDEXK-like domain-containing protein n=1 Tax=Larkinella humicola TaxID=2607654 RepID=A0A5N1J3Q5_9BACT|nr:PD-(D/E)XK nuclease-like domain-containing protein [Larkinella humicola]KAA9341199.1 hypothetical protein F0P93_30660 [Larkinella humicola]